MVQPPLDSSCTTLTVVLRIRGAGIRARSCAVLLRGVNETVAGDADWRPASAAASGGGLEAISAGSGAAANATESALGVISVDPSESINGTRVGVEGVASTLVIGA